MMPYASLRQKVNEVLSDFLRLYPTYQEFRGEMLELTEKRVSRRLADMNGVSLERYFIGQQLRVDITVELAKVAMLVRAFPTPIAPISPPASPEPSLFKTTTHFTYEKRGKVIYLPLRHQWTRVFS